MNDKAMQIAQLSGFAGLVLILLMLILFIGTDENMLWDMKTEPSSITISKKNFT